jgi:hypothetical protein
MPLASRRGRMSGAWIDQVNGENWNFNLCPEEKGIEDEDEGRGESATPGLSRAPMPVMAGGVNYGDDQNCVFCDLINHVVGKLLRKNPPDVSAPMATGGEQRVGGEPVNR